MPDGGEGGADDGAGEPRPELGGTEDATEDIRGSTDGGAGGGGSLAFDDADPTMTIIFCGGVTGWRGRKGQGGYSRKLKQPSILLTETFICVVKSTCNKSVER